MGMVNITQPTNPMLKRLESVFSLTLLLQG